MKILLTIIALLFTVNTYADALNSFGNKQNKVNNRNRKHKNRKKLEIISKPANASIYINGKLHFQKTPAVVKLIVGKIYKIEVKKRGFQSVLKEFRLKATGRFAIPLRIKRISKGDAIYFDMTDTHKNLNDFGNAKTPQESGLGGDYKKLTKKEILSVIKKVEHRIKGCVDREKHNKTSKTVKVKFKINPSGDTSSIKIRGTDNRYVRNCMHFVIGKLNFPKFNGNPIPITFPFKVK